MADELSRYAIRELEEFSNKMRDMAAEFETLSKLLCGLMTDAVKLGMDIAMSGREDGLKTDEVVYETTAQEVMDRRYDAMARQDHEAVRNAVGYYDFTHKLLEVSGMGARSFLDRMFVAGIAKARVGQAKYTTMLNANGEIIDDVIVFRIEDDKYWVSTLYINELISWFNANKADEDVFYKDITKEVTMYAVQGPASRDVLNGMLKENINALRQFHIHSNFIGNTEVMIARSGYTGELGFEVYCKPEDSRLVETSLEKIGASFGIRKVTTDVIVTSLPREKGYVLMSDIGGLNPLECGFGWSIDWNKDFIGKNALKRAREEGITKELMGFAVDDDSAVIEPDCEVQVNGVKVGRVTVYTYGYTVKKNIGFAVVEKGEVKIGDSVLIKSGGKMIPAVMTKRGWYDPENSRVRGETAPISERAETKPMASYQKKDSIAAQEHRAVRNAVGYYDFTHKLLEVRGADARRFLDRMFVSSISKARVGQAKYTTMLNENGDIIDDVIVFRIKEDEYWVSTLYIHELIAWFDAHKEREKVSYREITKTTTMYAVQGPYSRKVLNKMLANDISSQKYFTIEENRIGSVPVRIARSGYTGELGYEIYCNPRDAAMIEEKLEICGREYGIRKITTDVIVTSLPREKGFVLMSDLEGCNPLEVGFERTIDWNKDFIGRVALERVRGKGIKRNLLGFTLEDDADIHPGVIVKKNGEVVGRVTMYTYGYTVEKNIGYALVDCEKARAGDSVRIEDSRAVLCDRMFYDPENRRIRD